MIHYQDIVNDLPSIVVRSVEGTDGDVGGGDDGDDGGGDDDGGDDDDDDGDGDGGGDGHGVDWMLSVVLTTPSNNKIRKAYFYLLSGEHDCNYFRKINSRAISISYYIFYINNVRISQYDFQCHAFLNICFLIFA